jgi:hypothetical protein
MPVYDSRYFDLVAGLVLPGTLRESNGDDIGCQQMEHIAACSCGLIPHTFRVEQC